MSTEIASASAEASFVNQASDTHLGLARGLTTA